MSVTRSRVRDDIDEILPGVVADRRHLHQHPELGFQEVETARFVEERLRAIGIQEVQTGIATTGLTGLIRGGKGPGKVVLLRADMDALPIHEQNDVEYKSLHDGVMHACGHDVHATWAVGAAMLLRKVPAEGDVVILLQPAEEAAEGAAAVLESGALDGVSAIFGGHVDRRYQVGQVVAQVGPVAASADFFEIEITGAGGHGARPHECADPIVGAGALIGAIQTLIARRLDPAVPGVVTVATVHAGTADNIIPDRATLTGTVRAVDPKSRAFLLEELRHLSEGVAAAHRLLARVTFAQGTPPIVNLPGPTAWASDAVGAVLGTGAEVPLAGTNMGGEDFAFYLERMPGCFLRIGAREPKGSWLPAHSPGFYAAEESVFVGAAVLAETARRATAELSRPQS